LKLVRVGNVIRENGKKIHARYIHGLWYRRIKTDSGFEHIQCSDPEQKQFAAMPDARTLPFSEAESEAIKCAMNAVRGILPEDREQVELAVREGLTVGMTKYGPYNPKEEKRDLFDEARQEARDLIVYCSFLLATGEHDDRAQTLRKSIRSAADILVSLR
jgi:hypothetical protein